MTDDIWQREAVESPCTKVCVIDPTSRLCTGCLRSIDEITDWSRMTSDQRRDIMAVLPARAPRLAVRKGGRAARLKLRG